MAYTDKTSLTAYAQLGKVFLAYRQTLQAASFPISLLVICENSYRSEEFAVAVFQIFQSGEPA